MRLRGLQCIRFHPHLWLLHFVRLYVRAFTPDGEKVMTTIKGKNKQVFFDGGACVAPETLQGIAEPQDFDAFWKTQKKPLKT